MTKRRSPFAAPCNFDRTFGQAALNLGALLATLGQHMEAIGTLTRARETLNPEEQALLTPLIEHCLKESRTLTEPPFPIWHASSAYPYRSDWIYTERIFRRQRTGSLDRL